VIVTFAPATGVPPLTILTLNHGGNSAELADCEENEFSLIESENIETIANINMLNKKVRFIVKFLSGFRLLKYTRDVYLKITVNRLVYQIIFFIFVEIKA